MSVSFSMLPVVLFVNDIILYTNTGIVHGSRGPTGSSQFGEL